MRTFELYEKIVEFSPILDSEAEFAVLASDDVLYDSQLQFRIDRHIHKSYLVKVIELLTAVLAIPRLCLFLHRPVLLWRGRPAMSGTRVVSGVFVVLVKDAKRLLCLAFGGTGRWIVVVVDGGTDIVHV